MARIRSIKPEFFSSEQVADCSPIARLLFVGLWCFCDDGGVHPASAKAIKMRVFPGDDITADGVQKLIDELTQKGLLETFEAENALYWRVTGWAKHQKIDRPSFKYPQNSTSPRRTLDEPSPSDTRTLDGLHPPEWSGVDVDVDTDVEGSGVECHSPNARPTRIGNLCKELRAMSIDAAPHQFQHKGWKDLLERHSDEDILGAAALVRQRKPGERIGINYLVPILSEPPKPPPTAGPRGSVRTIHDERKNTIDTLTGRSGGNGSSDAAGAIPGESKRIAG